MEAYEYDAIEDGNTIRCKFFVKKNFVSHTQCDELIKYYEESDKKGVQFFDKRIIWFSHIPDTAYVKNIMRQARLDTIDLIKKFHHLNYEIYGDSIQLVSWPEGQGMPAHYDNRHPCRNEPHPTPWREYAGVIYLNDNYTGGELYISSANPPIILKPEKGMLVVFGGGDGFMHGVHPPYGSTRYTMPCWFTKDPAQKESDFSAY